MFLTTRVAPTFVRPQGSTFEVAAGDQYSLERMSYSEAAKQYFALSFDDRLEMAQAYGPDAWKAMPSMVQYDSVLVLRLTFGLRGI